MFILFSLCRTKSCILHFSAKVSQEIPLEPCTYFQEHSSCNWCLTKLEYNGMNFNLYLIFLHCSSTGKTDHTPVLCTSVLRYKHSVAFSNGLPGFYCVYFFFCRDKYNWPEEIDVCGRYCGWTVTTLLSEELVRKFTIIVRP